MGTINHAWFLVVAIQMAIWLDQGVQSWMRHLLYAPGSNKNPVTLVILGMILRVLVWSMMLLSILANVGVDITALVASLGVGGIAIALAVQTVLSDVFASLSIGFDKPFEIGDFVVFNDVAGTIEHMVKKIITDVGETQFDRAHLLAFGQDRLTYEVVHIVNTADYNKYMDIQQEINIRIIEKLIENDIELALPSLVVRAPVQVEETRDYSNTADAKNADKRVMQ